MSTQVHLSLFNTHSNTFTLTQEGFSASIMFIAFNTTQSVHEHSSIFNHVDTHSKEFMLTQLHVEISPKVHSVAFRLTQRHSPAPNCIKLCLWNTHLHSLTLNHVQLLSIEVNIWFMYTQTHSGVVSLNGIQSGQKNKGPMDMCSNMGSMEIWHRFALSIPWMLFKVW